MSRVPPSNADLDARRRLLHLAAEVLEYSQDDIAELVGVSQSLVSYWMSGERVVDWHIVMALVRRAIQAKPREEGRLVQALARQALGRQGTWIPEGQGGTWRKEGPEAVIALGRLHQAVEQGDPEEMEEEARGYIRESYEAGTAVIGLAKELRTRPRKAVRA